jgi:hypothetical protein
MLWAAGAYEQALATTFEFVVQHGNVISGDEVKMLWFGAMAGMELPAYRSAFDFEPEALRHTRTEVADTAETTALLESKIARVLNMESPHFDPDVYDRERQAMTITVRGFATAHWHRAAQFIEPLRAPTSPLMSRMTPPTDLAIRVCRTIFGVAKAAPIRSSPLRSTSRDHRTYRSSPQKQVY